jgi:predicted metalloprotease with PDZ domain
VPYTFDDVVRALNDVAPYDWTTLLRERVGATTTHAPLGGIEHDGWNLVYDDNPNLMNQAVEKLTKLTDFSYSIGISVTEDGTLNDVIVGSPAHKAGIGPGMRLVAINGRKWSPPVLRAALKSARQNSEPIELLVENAQFFKTYSVIYRDGDRNPHLERVSDQPDILSDLLKPLTH